MAGYLSVDVEFLSNTVASLRKSQTLLDEAMRAMAQGGHGEIGTQTLTAAANHFQVRWEFGMERISEATAVTTEGVDKCRQAYHDLDVAFSNAIKKATDSIPVAQPQR